MGQYDELKDSLYRGHVGRNGDAKDAIEDLEAEVARLTAALTDREERHECDRAILKARTDIMNKQSGQITTLEAEVSRLTSLLVRISRMVSPESEIGKMLNGIPRDTEQPQPELPWPVSGPDFNPWYQDAAKFLFFVQQHPLAWCRDFRLKYLNIRVDTRSGAFVMFARDGEEKVTPDDFIRAATGQVRGQQEKR